MRRFPWLLAILGAVVALAATAPPARASERHCGDQVAEAAPHHEHAVLAPTSDAVQGSEHQRCPECPTRTCSLLHGCSALVTCLDESPALVAVAIPQARALTLVQDRALPSFVASPPTPPPNALLSIPA